MLKYHEVIRPIAKNGFLEESLDLWLGFNAGHMGAHMYQSHKGVKEGQTMSGTKTWNEYAEKGTLPFLNREILASHILEVATPETKHLPIIEFGPGSMNDARTLVQTLQSKEYVPVDCSLEVIKNAQKLSENFSDCTVRPSVINFFSKRNTPLLNKPSFAAFLGGTIGNLPGPIPSRAPRNALVKLIKNLASTIPSGGYLLLSIDTCQDGERNKTFYNEPWHQKFGVNHLFRMADELPMKDFDPNGFIYHPVWHEHCGLLAHTVKATKNQTFLMGNDDKTIISVKEGDVFHYNNSYKYRTSFFERCVRIAGLSVQEKWGEDNSVQLYLLKVPAQLMAKRPLPYMEAKNRRKPLPAFPAQYLASVQQELGGANDDAAPVRKTASRRAGRN